MGFPRQEYWGGLLFPSPGDRPNPGIEPAPPTLAGGFFYHWDIWKDHLEGSKHYINISLLLLSTYNVLFLPLLFICCHKDYKLNKGSESSVTCKATCFVDLGVFYVFPQTSTVSFSGGFHVSGLAVAWQPEFRIQHQSVRWCNWLSPLESWNLKVEQAAPTTVLIPFTVCPPISLLVFAWTPPGTKN